MSLQRQMISGCLQFSTTAITFANLFTSQTCDWCQIETDSKSKRTTFFSSKSNQAEQILGFAKSKDTSLRANHLESLHSQIWQREQSIFKNIMEEDWHVFTPNLGLVHHACTLVACTLVEMILVAEQTP